MLLLLLHFISYNGLQRFERSVAEMTERIVRSLGGLPCRRRKRSNILPRRPNLTILFIGFKMTFVRP